MSHHEELQIGRFIELVEKQSAEPQALQALRDDTVVARLLAEADVALLQQREEYLVSAILPYCNAPLIGLLDTLLGHAAHSRERRAFAALMLQHYAALHPEYYGRVARVVGGRLQEFPNNGESVNGILVETCVVMQAEELLPVIQRAYQAGVVDSQQYPSAEDVEEALLLPATSFEAGLEQYMHTKELDGIRQQLEVYLDQHCVGQIKSVIELDGLLHALALSPTPVARSLWLALFEQGGEQTLLPGVGYELPEQQTEQLTTYYSEVKDALLAGEPAPHFEPSGAGLQSLLPWARGFLTGFALWSESDKLSIEQANAIQELLEFLHAVTRNEPLPEQYQSLLHSDFGMIVHLMVQRAFDELHQVTVQQTADGAPDLLDDSDNPLQDFFDSFSDDEQKD